MPFDSTTFGKSSPPQQQKTLSSAHNSMSMSSLDPIFVRNGGLAIGAPRRRRASLVRTYWEISVTRPARTVAAQITRTATAGIQLR